MAETAVSDVPDPEKPVTHRILPDLSNVNDFYQARYGDFSYNGRLGTPQDQITPFLMMPDPPVIARKVYRRWRNKVRAHVVRRQEMIKGFPAALKEKARIKVYDMIFGWILAPNDNASFTDGAPVQMVKQDIDLFL